MLMGLCKKVAGNAAGRYRCLSAAGMLDAFRKRLDAEDVGRGFDLCNDQLRDVMSRTTAAKRWDTGVGWPTTPGGRPSAAAVSRYLSVELTHGRYFRTRLTHVSDTDAVLRDTDTHPLPEPITTARRLFNHVAGRLAAFAGRHRVRDAGLPLAFTFGFPARLAVGHLAATSSRRRAEQEWWDRRDVAVELRAATRRARVAVGPVAVFSDACALMLNGRSARVGVVVGDGTSCCYADDVRGRLPDVAIFDTEWGGFGDDGALDRLSTAFDRRLDQRSACPGKRIFEKMTSGLYMGELVRAMVLQMTARKALFSGRFTRRMLTARALQPEHLCAVESDVRGSYDLGRAVLTRALDVADPTDMDCSLFRYACECVTKRSAHLVSAALAGVLRRLGPAPFRDAVTTPVAVGGYVFDKHPVYYAAVGRKTLELAGMAVSLHAGDHRRGAPLVARILAEMSSARPRET